MNDFSNYLVFVDEAGDHTLKPNNGEFPVFVLAFCVFEKNYYCNTVLPLFNLLKLKYFKDLNIIFHERDIRKHLNKFTFLTNQEIRKSFFEDLNLFMSKLDFTIISTVIHKTNLQRKYYNTYDPYHLAMTFCIERLRDFLLDNNNLKSTTVTFEARGKKEDKNLEIAFLQKVNNPFYGGKLDINIIDKKSNQSGLQIADLVARPIGRHVMNSSQLNYSFEIIKNKFRKDKNGNFIGCGLNIFP